MFKESAVAVCITAQRKNLFDHHAKPLYLQAFPFAIHCRIEIYWAGTVMKHPDH